MPGKSQGFTLLELLIAVTILVMLVGMVFASFASVTSSMDIARDNAERLRHRQVVWRNLTVNLQSVYADAACFQPEYQFLGESREGPQGPADMLRFVTSLSMPGARSLPGVLKVVTYELVDYGQLSAEIAAALPYDESRPSGVLLIREEPLQLETQDFAANSSDPAWNSYERAIPAASIDFQYFDGVAGEWTDAWDSVEERRLPGGVWVKVNLPRSEEERADDARAGINYLENPDLEYFVSFPLGRDTELPFPDFNHMRFDANEEQ